ncbi:hypothetical protein BASA61_003670 [Batrachochytrium salamandrivorans]|nr:hypothetical protein BASA61_003670 [Batrachochytrium salamandrivorans]
MRRVMKVYVITLLAAMATVVSACSRPPCPATTTADQHLRSHRSQHQRPDQSSLPVELTICPSIDNDTTSPPLLVKLTICPSITNDKTSPPLPVVPVISRSINKPDQTCLNPSFLDQPVLNHSFLNQRGVKPFLPQPTGNQSAIPQPTNSQSTDSQPTGFPSTPQINQHHMEANNQTEPQTSGHLYSEVAPLGLSASAIIMAILAIF